jgi:flagellar hook-associated protein FlgK
MTDSLRIAVSGLNAAAKKVQAAASNIAGASVPGYVPVESNNTSQVAGNDGAGVLASFSLTGLPPVNVDAEVVNLLTASAAYKANAAVIRTEDQLTDALLSALDTRA